MTITPRTLKGFRDFLPADMRIRLRVINAFRETFERYGYEPLETPTLEYADILMGKYGEEAEKLIYSFQDRGGRNVAMRYDVTVPACRVFAQYQNDLPAPFKRYQIQPVWRADNTQKGRFREFYQCDADTFGTSSPLAEAEFIAMGVEVLRMLGFTDFAARVNNRKIIDGIAKYAGARQEHFYTICVAIDKLSKIGRSGVVKEMREKGISGEVIAKIETVLDTTCSPNSFEELDTLFVNIPEAREGIREIQQIFNLLELMEVSKKHYRYDSTIIRGLSYYTGTVWEFEIADGGVGSVGGGGRYDKLVGAYLGKDVPAAGGSFGIERLIEIIKDRGMASDGIHARVLVAVRSDTSIASSLSIAAFLRREGIATTVYPDALRIDKQLKYADRKGFTHVIIPEDERELRGDPETWLVRLKNMRSGTEQRIPVAKISSQVSSRAS